MAGWAEVSVKLWAEEPSGRRQMENGALLKPAMTGFEKHPRKEQSETSPHSTRLQGRLGKGEALKGWEVPHQCLEAHLGLRESSETGHLPGGEPS